MRTPLLLAAGAALALTVLPGCGKKIDHKKLEKAIVKKLTEKKLPVKSVSCPKGVKEKKGEIFYCTAVATDGTKADIEVKMLGGGNVHWQLKVPKAKETAKPPGGAPTVPAKDKPATDKPAGETTPPTAK